LKAAPKLLGGDLGGALEAGGPVAFRNIAKGLDIYQTGMYRDTRGSNVTEASGLDALMKSIGLQPQGVAAESRVISTKYEMRALYSTVRNEITTEWALGLFEQDQDRIKKARDAMNRWNERNPEARIVIDPGTLRRRVVEMRRERADRFVRSSPKAIRPAMAEGL
jgi:hypothetical protein